jgi:deoxyribodipyrimidine photolyase-related protein
MLEKTSAAVIYPHQLFQKNPVLAKGRTVHLVEDPWFFTRLRFHAQKLVLHRATMRGYRRELESRGYQVRYWEAGSLGKSADLFTTLAEEGVQEVHIADTVERGLEEAIGEGCRSSGIRRVTYESPMFLCTREYLEEFFRGRRRFYLTEFYIAQRKRHGILLEPDGKPVGKRWTWDTLNREPLHPGIPVPTVWKPGRNRFITEALTYVRRDFPESYGDPDRFSYPVTRGDALRWFADFLEHRLASFGPYEDAIHAGEPVLFHSVLSPLLNIGLLSPREVVEGALAHARDHEIPLPSLEGFVRQMIGWREFIRAVYHLAGEDQRSGNALGSTTAVPPCFWSAETGILPVDTVTKRVLATGYCHHIERLMVLGNLMLLCNFHPDEVYRWFSELFIDAYDWVMVPNVYGMSQFADGGLMSSKPYISASRYLLRMSNFPEGPWCELWDALFWRFLHLHRDIFAKNPRMAPILSHVMKMPEGERAALLGKAEGYLASIGACEYRPPPTPPPRKKRRLSKRED